jgi:hypothetical protein
LKLIGLIEMCLNETYSEVLIDEHLSDEFHIQNGLKHRGALLQLLLVCLEYIISKVYGNRWVGIEWDTSASDLC